jgi:hypothetical protein
VCPDCVLVAARFVLWVWPGGCGGAGRLEGLDEKVIEVYQGVGKLLARYTNGKVRMSAWVLMTSYDLSWLGMLTCPVSAPTASGTDYVVYSLSVTVISHSVCVYVCAATIACCFEILSRMLWMPFKASHGAAHVLNGVCATTCGCACLCRFPKLSRSSPTW